MLYAVLILLAIVVAEAAAIKLALDSARKKSAELDKTKAAYDNAVLQHNEYVASVKRLLDAERILKEGKKERSEQNAELIERLNSGSNADRLLNSANIMRELSKGN